MSDHVKAIDKYTTTGIAPGSYRFRFSQFLPWMNVKVFLSSVTETNTCVKIAGLQLDAQKFFKLGYWKSV